MFKGLRYLSLMSRYIGYTFIKCLWFGDYYKSGYFIIKLIQIFFLMIKDIDKKEYNIINSWKGRKRYWPNKFSIWWPICYRYSTTLNVTSTKYEGWFDLVHVTTETTTHTNSSVLTRSTARFNLWKKTKVKKKIRGKRSFEYLTIWAQTSYITAHSCLKNCMTRWHD